MKIAGVKTRTKIREHPAARGAVDVGRAPRTLLGKDLGVGYALELRTMRIDGFRECHRVIRRRQQTFRTVTVLYVLSVLIDEQLVQLNIHAKGGVAAAGFVIGLKFHPRSSRAFLYPSEFCEKGITPRGKICSLIEYDRPRIVGKHRSAGLVRIRTSHGATAYLVQRMEWARNGKIADAFCMLPAVRLPAP